MAKVNKTNKNRIIYAFIIIAALIVALALRTAWIQVVKADDYSQKATNQQMSDIPLEAKRGAIYDTKGQELAASATCYSIWVRPAQIKKNYTSSKISELSEKLAVILDVKSSDVEKDMTSSTTLVKVARYLNKSTIDKIKKLDITGLEVAENTKRYYPFGTSAAQLLGSVNDDNEGRTGIEAEFDGYLSGVAGRWIKETDLNGETLSYGSQKYYQAKDGYNVTLTLDEVLQHYAEKAVAKGLAKTKAKRIMCLVMDPKTGDIKAMVTSPSYDPNDATEPVSSSAKKYFNSLSDNGQSKYLSSMWKNPIISDTYEPGSTFKLITTSAALEEGVTTPSTRYYDSGSITVDGTTLHCWDLAGHGAENLVQAVGNSCNPVQVRLALGLGKDKYYNYLEMFGITSVTHVDLPGETSAIIKSKSSLTNVDLATMAYGQGIAVTPIQLLTAVCAIGNGGVMMQPRIVEKLTDSNGKTVKKYDTVKVRKVISSKTASEMRDIMEYVVEKGGGGNAKITGYRIGGKTGTADKVVNGSYTSDTYSSFVGMAPIDNPKLAVLIVVDSPKGVQYGSTVAAPIAKNFLQNALTYMEITPTYTKAETRSQSATYAYVPNVTGKSFSDAIGILGGYGLKYKASPSSASKSDFKVVDQYPKAGKRISKGGTVYLYKK